VSDTANDSAFLIPLCLVLIPLEQASMLPLFSRSGIPFRNRLSKSLANMHGADLRMI
jgi:hypothetical protein